MASDRQYFSMVLFTLYKVILTSKPVDKIPKCDHSNESAWTVLSRCVAYYTTWNGAKLNVFFHAYNKS